MSADKSFALKEFVGLSDMSYIKFNRAMFYFSGSWFLAPINRVREIRFNAKKNYTSMASHVVDMSRVVKKRVLRFLERWHLPALRRAL